MGIEDLISINVSKWDANRQLADPDLLMYYQGLEDRDLWLEEDIEWATVSFIIKYIQFLNKKSLDRKTPITIHIYSHGGDVQAMWSLVAAMDESEIPIITINEGATHSAAFQIFLAGHQRKMRPNAFFIVHEGSAQLGGNFRETRQAMAHYEKEVKKMAAFIADRTTMSVEFIQDKFSVESDWYVDAEKAIEYGIINE